MSITVPTPLPYSPFVDVARVDPDNRFVLDENRFLRDIMEPDDNLPIFLTEPSPEFIANMHRELAPIIEACARR